MPVGIGSGLDAQFGLAEEAFWGTAVTVDRFLEIISESIDDRIQSLDSPPSLGRGMFPRHDRTISYQMGGAGPTVHQVTNKGFGKLLKLMFGNHVLTWPGSTNASQVLTFVANPTANDTVTIGTTVYTYKATVSTVAFEVLIGSTFALSLRNLANAINLGSGSGTWYGSLTTVHPQVVATYGATTLTATDKLGLGATANTVATTETLTNAGNVWTDITLLLGANGTDTARLHTFTVGDRGTFGRSATLQINRPSRDGNERPFTYPGAKVMGWTLSVGLDGWVMLEVTWSTNNGTTATALATATYPSGASNFNFTQIVTTVGGTTIPIKSFSISGAWAMQDDTRLLNNTRREPLANGFWNVTGTMEAEFQDMTAYTAFLAATQAALVATITGGVIPSSASTFALIITLAAMKYTGSSPMVSGPDVLTQNLPFSTYNNGSDPTIKLEYRTSDTTA